MVHGEKCPACQSKNVLDNKIQYTYDDVAKTSADFYCEDCGCDYQVIYKAEKIKAVPFDKDMDDLDYDKEYEVIL